MIAALILQAVAPAAVFAPPLDVPIRYTIEETRTNGAAPQRLTMTRSVVFRRTDDGYVADVTTLSARGEPDNAFARLFLAGASSFVGHSLRIRLDAAGRVIDVVDREAQWRGWLARMTAAMAKHGERASRVVEQATAPYRAATPARQIEALGEQVATLIGSDVVARGPTPTRVIRLPARDACAAELAGTERITRRADGALAYEQAAEGMIGAGGVTHILRTRIVDPATGLARETHERTSIALGGRTLVTERRTTWHRRPVS